MVTLNTEIKPLCLAASLLAERQIFFTKIKFPLGPYFHCRGSYVGSVGPFVADIQQ